MKKFLVTVLVILVSLSCVFAGGAKETPVTTTETDMVATPKGGVPLADVRVRQAIAYAIDMKAIVDSLMDGKAVVANSLTPNGDWKVAGLNDYAYNPTKAKQLLKEAGWDSNQTLDVVYYYGDQMTVDLMTAVQAYLGDVGIKMTFRKLEGDLGSQLWVPPTDPVNGPSAVKWDLAYAAIGALSMNEYYDRFITGGGSNSHTPSDPTYDKLIDATHVVDVASQKAAFKAVQKYENDNLPAIPLYYQQVFVAQSTRLDRAGAGYGNEQFNYDWNIINWTVPADANGKKVLKTNGGPVQFVETPFLNPGLYMSQKVLFDHLVVADTSLTPSKGELAESYTVSPDGKTITFVLRDDIFWHDGEPITASDVKWTYEFASKVPALNAVFSSMLKHLQGYDAFVNGSATEITGITTDGRNVTFTYSVADPNALLCFTQFPPLPKKYFANVDPLQFQQASFWQNPVGSGPYMVKEIQMNNYATFVPFAKYYKGKAKIDEIQMYPSGESDPNLVKNAAAGQLDYAYTKSVQDVLALEQMPNVKVTPVDIRYTRLFFVNKFPKP
ncbi:extracellular solute-binding protein, family 5 [Sphaerochaeta pleomorpha str. Grapes]|uniref:Extracellular solute-binding protein, family 5 n=1 Tax=Sphaerochaeta pleomorpha (strain ATCC BAA-1885 / DSM 22778 / Grapes) TaxID=158190 RepID=G8QVP0_SPHPG|nr:ABC transporter substrate-binding protein [Sphaerochaeta pleomorpha]AEV29332.1 extracellular solute-binding protein, family 5 [Sphaerochaeta pleomorpha str. Grapes]